MTQLSFSLEFTPLIKILCLCRHSFVQQPPQNFMPGGLSMNRNFTFNKPSPNHIASNIRRTLEKEIALFPVDLNCIAVTLTAGFHCGCLTYIQNTVDLEFGAVGPCDLIRQNMAQIVKAGVYCYIHLVWISFTHIVEMARICL